MPDTLHSAIPYPVNFSSSIHVNATGHVSFLDLCPWPAVEIYKGKCDPALAASRDCVSGTNRKSIFGENPGGR